MMRMRVVSIVFEALPHACWYAGRLQFRGTYSSGENLHSNMAELEVHKVTRFGPNRVAADMRKMENFIFGDL